MFELGLPLLLYAVNSIAGSTYVQKFFRGKYEKKVVLFVWTSLYFIIQSLMLERLDTPYSAENSSEKMSNSGHINMLF